MGNRAVSPSLWIPFPWGGGGVTGSAHSLRIRAKEYRVGGEGRTWTEGLTWTRKP